MNILVVDDQVDFHYLLSIHLEDEPGWKVFTAVHGKAALEILSQQKIDIIISDVYMPIMDGIKLFQAVRSTSQYACIPFIFISAYDDAHTLSVIQLSKNETFIKKGELFSVIKEWIVYLTTPVSQRPLHSPRMKPKEKTLSVGRSYDRKERLGERASPVFIA
jgi:two-component system chemotaxis response regulator CheY